MVMVDTNLLPCDPCWGGGGGGKSVGGRPSKPKREYTRIGTHFLAVVLFGPPQRLYV
jgi:hypothetical protein